MTDSIKLQSSSNSKPNAVLALELNSPRGAIECTKKIKLSDSNYVAAYAIVVGVENRLTFFTGGFSLIIEGKTFNNENISMLITCTYLYSGNYRGVRKFVPTIHFIRIVATFTSPAMLKTSKLPGRLPSPERQRKPDDHCKVTGHAVDTRSVHGYGH